MTQYFHDGKHAGFSLFNEKVGRIEDAIAQARRWTADALQFCRLSSAEKIAKEPDVWVPPSGDILKISTDGAF
jgi:hypothetical protein